MPIETGDSIDWFGCEGRAFQNNFDLTGLETKDWLLIGIP